MKNKKGRKIKMEGNGNYLIANGILSLKIDPNQKSFLLYMKALAYKRLGQNKEASKFYFQLMKRNRYQEMKHLWVNVWSILLLPNSYNRRRILNVLENIVDGFYQYGDISDTVHRPLMREFYSPVTDSWFKKMDFEILEELKSRPFFSRFEVPELLRFI